VPDYIGHRERLRDRFLKGGPKALPDYELLELALFAAVSRVDTKPLAKALIAKFGSFAEAIAAPRERLLEVEGVGEKVVTLLKVIEAASLRLAQGQVLNRPALSSWAALIDYCTAAMARSPHEEFRVLFLDRKNTLIADEVQSRGTIDHTPVYPREIVKRALELGASSMILVHNHPSGDPTPSKADQEMTHQIAKAAAALKIALHDHLVIGGADTSALRRRDWGAFWWPELRYRFRAFLSASSAANTSLRAVIALRASVRAARALSLSPRTA
jgi:DNA repair protein RadC